MCCITVSYFFLDFKCQIISFNLSNESVPREENISLLADIEIDYLSRSI